MFLCPDLVNNFHKNTFDPYFILRSVDSLFEFQFEGPLWLQSDIVTQGNSDAVQTVKTTDRILFITLMPRY